MSSMECVPGGAVRTHKWFRVWWCKAYVLDNRADRCKDWREKANTGYFVKYSKYPKGWGVYIPPIELVEFFAHVLFDEKIPKWLSDYFR